MIRTYTDLSKLETLEERFNYLQLGDRVGKETFGFDRYINQVFYKHQEWKQIRNEIIVRDNGCELGLEGYEIGSSIYVHHMNPVTINDIEEWSAYLVDPEYLVCMSFKMHNAIHFGDSQILGSYEIVERSPNDTKLW